jgi:hypothetical protein
VHWSSIAFWSLVVIALASAPSLLTGVAWALHQPWITLPLLLIVALAKWKPKHASRALLVGAALVHQQWTRRRQSKTATA